MRCHSRRIGSAIGRVVKENIMVTRDPVNAKMYANIGEKMLSPGCIKGESNPRRVDGNDPGYHYPINASATTLLVNL